MKKLLCLFALLVGLSTASFAATTPAVMAVPVALATTQNQVASTVMHVASQQEAVALTKQLTAGKDAKVAEPGDVTVIIICSGNECLVIVIVELP